MSDDMNDVKKDFTVFDGDKEVATDKEGLIEHLGRIINNISEKRRELSQVALMMQWDISSVTSSKGFKELVTHELMAFAKMIGTEKIGFNVTDPFRQLPTSFLFFTKHASIQDLELVYEKAIKCQNVFIVDFAALDLELKFLEKGLEDLRQSIKDGTADIKTWEDRVAEPDEKKKEEKVLH